MSRRGGLQGRSLAMFKRLDEVADDWKSLTDLASALEEEFGREYNRARRIVNEWALTRGDAISTAKAGRTYFFIAHPNKAPDAAVLAVRYWGQLPASFKRDHDFTGMPNDDVLHAILLAYGYYIHGRKDCRTAFNKWAQSRRMRLIQKEL